jgi:hypothetical protein
MSGYDVFRPLFGLGLAALAVSGCAGRDCTTAPGLALWVTYADSYGSGSAARAEELYGDLIVDLDKAADVLGNPTQPKYAYSGIMIFAAPSRSGINASDVDALKIDYSSTGPLRLSLEQEGISSGEDFRTSLAAAKFPQTVSFKLDQSTFYQPPWTVKSASLTTHRLVAFKFELDGNSQASTHLILRTIAVEGRDVCILRRPD